MNFTFSKFSGVAASAVWTLGWMLVADLAVERLIAFDSGWARVNVLVSILGIGFGCLMTFRFFPRNPALYKTKPTPPEPWHRRVTGWFGAIVWCGAGAIWNLAVFSILIQSATKGQSVNFIILIPFALIGLFLLLLLFTGIALALDFLFRLTDEDSSISTEPVETAPPIPKPAPLTEKSVPTEPSPKKMPVLIALLLISFVNWFVFAGISIHLGGDAMGVLPSRDGFILKSHGHHTAVSESIWIFSLYYSAATLLATPLIWLLYAARQFGGRWKSGRLHVKIFVGLFLLVWIVGWYSSIGSSFHHSLQDWQQLKHRAGATPSSR